MLLQKCECLKSLHDKIDQFFCHLRLIFLFFVVLLLTAVGEMAGLFCFSVSDRFVILCGLFDVGCLTELQDSSFVIDVDVSLLRLLLGLEVSDRLVIA